MKKWLDDLYAILMKRGFHTLDNSLKNYDVFDKQISKEVQSGTILSGEALSYNLSNFDSKIDDIILVKCVFNNGYLVVVPYLKLSEDRYNQCAQWSRSTSIGINVIGSMLSIRNSSDSDLTYSLSINII